MKKIVVILMIILVVFVSSISAHTMYQVVNTHYHSVSLGQWMSSDQWNNGDIDGAYAKVTNPDGDDTDMHTHLELKHSESGNDGVHCSTSEDLNYDGDYVTCSVVASNQVNDVLYSHAVYDHSHHMCYLSDMTLSGGKYY